MPGCTDEKTLYKDVKFCQGSKSLPGIRRKFRFASVRDIVSYPTMPSRNAEGMSLAKIPVYDGNFTLAAGKTFTTVDLVNNDGKITVEQQGSEGSRTFRVTAPLHLPGTEEEATGLIAEMLNDEIIGLVQMRNGKFRVIGSEAFPATVNPSQDTGAAPTDANQTSLEVVADDEYPAPFYVGKLPTEDGELDCKTGELTKAAS